MLSNESDKVLEIYLRDLELCQPHSTDPIANGPLTKEFRVSRTCGVDCCSHCEMLARTLY